MLLGACTLGGGWSAFLGEELAEGEVRLSVEGDSGYLRWAEVAGATEYSVTHSPTRFGSYSVVAKTGEPRLLVREDLYDYFKVTALVDGKPVEVGEPASVFCHTLVIGEGDNMEAVQARIDEVHARLEKGSSGQFSSERFAIFLLPGSYPSLTVRVGYYTSVHGLGANPADVTVGALYVSDQVLSNQNATCTFWRSVENFTVTGDVTFAVSQATSMRRMNFLGGLRLSYSGWSSGGFLANSRVAGNVEPGSQQQWMSRNDEWTRWTSGGSHNYVFSGCTGSIPADAWSERAGRVTVLEETEKMAEKPFLTYTEGEYRVFVPEVCEGTSGVTWGSGIDAEAGYFLPLSDFYIMSGHDTASSVNRALDGGKHLLIPADVFSLEAPISVKNAKTVVMGVGYGTLTIADTNAEGALCVADVDGVRLADLLIDAGAYSKSMVVVGEAGRHTSHASDPTVISDLYLRIGGKENVHTETENALILYSDDVLGDNFWLWRADHSRGVAWEDTEYEDEEGNLRVDYGNPVKTGILVEGDRVSAYALMVEHCEGYQTDWRGEEGLVVMYQSETPYRVPSQESWMSPNGKKGCASYRVAEDVTKHRAYGIGIYLVNYSDVVLDSAIEVPEREGISMNHLVICDFTQTSMSSITNVINDYGGGVSPTTFRALVEKYPM